ncbi:MAG: HAMP domain-containing histidine kinase [Rhodocyclaceae bacterium]|jgi:signal transduction histidine kinase|nr:HAMP domain-containing histidine kinase [Rhodocyclaceae bacterium]MCL4757270.1 HAMP domain-containing histidine kinase [Rhodocyclaceae bacterium]
MHRILDILSSGIHDAKNQLFLAESLIAQAEAEHGLKLDEARFAIEHAASRLSRLLTAYKLQRKVGSLSIDMVSVPDLLEEAALISASHCTHLGLRLNTESPQGLGWLLDRELLLDILTNAIQNACRYARSQITLSATADEKGLTLKVEDDGPGYSEPDVETMTGNGVGLFVAAEIARMHKSGARHGKLALANGGRHGGAVFELFLP